MKPRVLFLCASTGIRGAHQMLMDYFRLLFKDSFECIVAVPPEDGPFVPALQSLGINPLFCDQPWWVTGNPGDHWLYCMRRLPNAVENVRKIIQKEQPDVVYSNAGVSPAGAFAAVLEKKPHISHVHECLLNPDTGLSTPAGHPARARTVGELSCFVITASNHLASEYLPYVPKEKIRVIYSGIECRQFADIIPSAKENRILSIGTTSVAKGLDDLVDAARLLSQRNISFHVDILGTFDQISYQNHVRQRLVKLNIEKIFHFHEFQKDIRYWLENSSVLCCPSHAESFSRAVVEGMTAGLPVVATRCGGPEDIVLNNETGHLIPIKNPSAMADAITDIISHPAKAEEMGKKGRQRALELFDAPNTAAQCAETIREAAGMGEWLSPATGTAEMLMAVLTHSGPRILIGKKWRLISQIFRLLGRSI